MGIDQIYVGVMGAGVIGHKRLAGLVGRVWVRRLGAQPTSASGVAEVLYCLSGAIVIGIVFVEVVMALLSAR